jgi:hypothetical protein
MENPNKRIWKAKLPLKIKMVLWLLQQDVILTKDNLIKRKWLGDKSCRFYTLDENSNHLFFDCSLARYVWSLVAMVVGANCRPSNLNQFWVWCEKFFPANRNLHTVGLAAICWALWQARNLVCFEKKKIRSPTEIICRASSFLIYWAGLQQEEAKAILEVGAEALKEALHHHHPQAEDTADQADPATGVVLLY